MTQTNRILPIALVAALLGGSVGAFVMRAPKTAETTANTPAATTASAPVQATNQALPVSNEQAVAANLTGEQSAFRDGFEEGFLAAQEKGAEANYSTANQQSKVSATPINYQGNNRSRSRRVARSGNNSRQVYYDYEQRQPQKRSFWSKHRDKLTVAAGAGGGALIGGLIGGKKGALIGGLAGGGGSALYTYKLRKKDRRN